jgi:hypothetical protein
MYRYTTTYLTACLIALLALVSSCDSLEKEIVVPLPPHKPELVVECYLENGKPYQVFVTQTVSYFEPLGDNFFAPYDDATVVISDGTYSDTLRQEYSFDFFTFKFNNYVGNFAALNDPSIEYTLEVLDNKSSRRVKGKTRFLPKPKIDTVEYAVRDSAARMLFWIKDPPGESNYYRLIMYRDSVNSAPVLNFTFSDANFNGQRFPVGTSYRFRLGDLMFVRLFHITKDQYDYLELLGDASRANGNPFAQPVTIQSPIQGGYGIFSALSYDEKIVRILPK